MPARRRYSRLWGRAVRSSFHSWRRLALVLSLWSIIGGIPGVSDIVRAVGVSGLVGVAEGEAESPLEEPETTTESACVMVSRPRALREFVDGCTLNPTIEAALREYRFTNRRDSNNRCSG